MRMMKASTWYGGRLLVEPLFKPDRLYDMP